MASALGFRLDEELAQTPLDRLRDLGFNFAIFAFVTFCYDFGKLVQQMQGCAISRRQAEMSGRYGIVR